MSQGHRPSGSGEDFKGVHHIWAWRPSGPFYHTLRSIHMEF